MHVISLLQVGLPGFDSMPSALNMLSKHERASYCNRYWENEFKKVCKQTSLICYFHFTLNISHHVLHPINVLACASPMLVALSYMYPHSHYRDPA